MRVRHYSLLNGFQTAHTSTQWLDNSIPRRNPLMFGFSKKNFTNYIIIHTELGTLLFEIAQLLFTLERTLILGANEQFKKKSSNKQTDKIKF